MKYWLIMYLGQTPIIIDSDTNRDSLIERRYRVVRDCQAITPVSRIDDIAAYTAIVYGTVQDLPCPIYELKNNTHLLYYGHTYQMYRVGF